MGFWEGCLFITSIYNTMRGQILLPPSQISYLYSHFELSLSGALHKCMIYKIKASIKFIQNSEFRIWNSEFRIRNSEFRIGNSDFRIRNSEFRIQNSEFRIQNCELLLTFKSYLQWYIGPILQCNSYVHNNPYCTDYHSSALVTNNYPCVPPTLGRTSTLQSTSTPMEYLQRTPTPQVTHNPYSVLSWVGSTR